MSRRKKGTNEHEFTHRVKVVSAGEIKLPPGVLPWEVELLRPAFVAIARSQEVHDAT